MACNRCGSEQNVLVKGKGYCKECNNKYGKKYYAENRVDRLKKIAVNVANLRERRKALVNELKDSPCQDCGVKYPPYVMDFDHKRGDKIANISVMVNRRGTSLSKLKEELLKCDLVCANCHRERTHGGIAQG